MVKILHSLAIASMLAFSGCGGDGTTENDGIEYIAIGASDAFGIGATPITNGYVYLIEQGIESQGEEVSLTNLGIPGADADQIEDSAVSLALAEDPHLITIFVGANDIVDGRNVSDFDGDLNGILSRLKQETSALLVIATIPDITKLPAFQSSPDPDVTLERVEQYNSAILSRANQYGALIADLQNAPLNDSLVNDQDGFHPNDAGHRVIADIFLNEIAPFIPELAGN